MGPMKVLQRVRGERLIEHIERFMGSMKVLKPFMDEPFWSPWTVHGLHEGFSKNLNGLHEGLKNLNGLTFLEPMNRSWAPKRFVHEGFQNLHGAH